MPTQERLCVDANAENVDGFHKQTLGLELTPSGLCHDPESAQAHGAFDFPGAIDNDP